MKTAATTPAERQRIKVEGDINLTDLGNARRLVKTHGHNMRYCQSTEKWYLWSGSRWVEDIKEESATGGDVVQTRS